MSLRDRAAPKRPPRSKAPAPTVIQQGQPPKPPRHKKQDGLRTTANHDNRKEAPMSTPAAAQLGPFEQVLRIALNAGGSALFGSAVMQGDMAQAAIGAAVTLVSVGWWAFRQYQVAKAKA